jgi:hypothetical protein
MAHPATTFNSERCVELARASHLDGTARQICTGHYRELFEIPSKNRSSSHIVSHVYASHGLYCDCVAAQKGQCNCAHIGATILYIDCRSQVIAQAKREWAA